MEGEINPQIEGKVPVYLCEKSRSERRHSECAALTTVGSESIGYVMQLLYIGEFPTYSTMKEGSYIAADGLFAHPVANRLMELRNRVFATYFEPKPKK